MREVIMNKKILMASFLAFIMLLVPINSAYSNNSSSVRNNVENKYDNTPLNDKWLRIFDNTARDIGTSVQLTTDGGYIVTGIAEPLSGWIGAFVIKLDRNGNKTWGKVMGGLEEDRAVIPLYRLMMAVL